MSVLELKRADAKSTCNKCLVKYFEASESSTNQIESIYLIICYDLKPIAIVIQGIIHTMDM